MRGCRLSIVATVLATGVQAAEPAVDQACAEIGKNYAAVAHCAVTPREDGARMLLLDTGNAANGPIDLTARSEIYGAVISAMFLLRTHGEITIDHVYGVDGDWCVSLARADFTSCDDPQDPNTTVNCTLTRIQPCDPPGH